MGTTQSKKAGPRISEIAREKKLQFFFGQIRQDAKILDVGCAGGWAEKWARERGWTDITGLDLTPPADGNSGVVEEGIMEFLESRIGAFDLAAPGGQCLLKGRLRGDFEASVAL